LADDTAVEHGENLVQHPLRGEEPVGWIGGREEDADLLGQQGTQPTQEMAIGHVLVPGVEPLLVFGMIGEVELKALRLHPPADRFPKPLPADPDLPGLHHLVGTEPVQMREGDLPHELRQGVPGLVAERSDVPQVRLEVSTVAPVLFGQVFQAGFVFDVNLVLLAAAVDAELSL